MKRLLLCGIGLLSLSAVAQNKGMTIQADVFPMGEFPAAHRTQILTKGYDSAQHSWSLDYSRGRFGAKSHLNFRVNRGKGISAPVELELFKTSRITLCFENGKGEIYLNGTKIGEKENITMPLVNQHSLQIGKYPGNRFIFPGKVTNVKILEKVVRPEKFTSAGTETTHLHFVAPSKNIPFKPVSGKWYSDKFGYREFSDHIDVNALAVNDKIMPESFVLTARVITVDNMGKIILEFCRQDNNNCYRLVLDGNNTQRELNLYKVEKGKASLLASRTSVDTQIPTSGSRTAPLTISIGRHEGMIHVRLNSIELLQTLDDTFKKGTVAIGVHERKAQFAEVSVKSYSGYAVEKKPVALPKQEIRLSTDTCRTVFYDDETIAMTAEFINRTPDAMKPGKMQVVYQKKKESRSVSTVPATGTVKQAISVKASDLNYGKNTVKVTDGKLSAEMNITVVRRPQKDLYRFYCWTGGDLAVMNANGFNGINLNLTPKDDVQYRKKMIASRTDYAMLNNMSIGIQIALLSAVPAGGNDMCVVRKDGTRSIRLNARNEKTIKYICSGMEKIAKFLKDYPAINRILLDSEIENFLEQGYAKEDIDRARKELGFEPPISETANMEIDNTAGRVVRIPQSVKKATPAVFPTDNKYYRFMSWFWDRGAGDNLIRAQVAKIIKKERPDIQVYHDPYRNVPLSSRMEGMDFAGTWFYCHPDAGETFMAVESMLSACRAGGRPEKFQLDPSLWLYSYKIGPAKGRWAGVQPANIYLTALHLGFAAKPEMIEIYDLNFLLPTSKPEFREKHIRQTVSDFAKKFVKPLWSATRHLEREQPKTALMLSFGSQIFNRSYWGGYGNSSANTILNLFWKANIPTAIITEETIRKGELANYDQILLYRTSHLPQDVFDKLKTFADKGGKILTEPDSPWAKLFPKAVKFPIETEKITDTTYWSVKHKKGFTADVMYAEQQNYAKALRKFKQAGSTFADTESTELYIRTLQSGDCKYVFLMNDKRTFGDYFGKKYKSVYDAGLPLKADVSLKTNGAVYEFPAKKKLELKNGKVSLDFKPVEGKLLIVYPEAVGAVKVENIPTFQAGKKAVFKISVLNGKQKQLKGIQPIRVLLTMPNGQKMEQFISAKNGSAEFVYVPGQNEPNGKWKLEAEELASGTKTVREWTR